MLFQYNKQIRPFCIRKTKLIDEINLQLHNEEFFFLILSRYPKFHGGDYAGGRRPEVTALIQKIKFNE